MTLEMEYATRTKTRRGCMHKLSERKYNMNVGVALAVSNNNNNNSSGMIVYDEVGSVVLSFRKK